MKLLTKANLRSLPPLYSRRKSATRWCTSSSSRRMAAGRGTPQKAHRKGMTLSSLGLSSGRSRSGGHFSRSDLLNVRGALGLPIERDRHLEPMPISEALHRDGLDRFSPVVSIHSPLTSPS